MKKIPIGITYGDPTGIGPEIVLDLLKNWNSNALLPIAIKHKQNIKTKFKPGKPSKESGYYSYLSLKEAVKLVKEKKIKALITGPVSKSYISLSIKGFRGQTDEIAKLCNINPKKVIMLFVSYDLRIALFTRHIPLKKVSSSIRKEDLIDFILLLNAELKKWFKIKNPKIGILGLNPHAGENGIIGKEEIKIILPAIKILKRKKINVSFPLSPDATLANAGQNYLNKKTQEYDVFVSLYHDQALPMFKAVSGKNGLNISLGLPFIRVSPDHGTAFNIAGKKKADSTSMFYSLDFLEDLFK